MLSGAEWRALRAIEQHCEHDDPRPARQFGGQRRIPAAGRAPAPTVPDAEEVDPRVEVLCAGFLLALAIAFVLVGLATVAVGLLVAAVVLGTAGTLWWRRARRLCRARRRP
jgi:Flp pilus assembly protein TadB